ncbi:hypothetical protein ACWG0P_11100 [Amedibacillus sp. YH-ame6]
MKSFRRGKIKTVLIIVVVLLISIFCATGYYFWISYHPEISIWISDASSGGGKEFKIKAPQISIGVKHGIEPEDSINSKIKEISTQHEALCKYVVENYKSSDIKLDMEVKNDTTILAYHGTVTTLNGENIDFEKEVKLDFTLDADITYQK